MTTATLAIVPCTCGPHPRIDLTAAYAKSADQEESSLSLSSSCREQILNACRTHGCFHVNIDLDDDGGSSGNATTTPLKCLAKPHQQIEQDIESLFQPPSCLPSNDDGWKEICNGGLYEVPFSLMSSYYPSQNSTVENEVDENNILQATFRGRIAESGDEQQSTPEPKLSWEFRRCLQMQGTQEKVAEDDDDEDVLRNNNADLLSRHSLNLLPMWIDALHSVATTVIRLLDIPPQIVLQEKQCRCMNRSIHSNNAADRRCENNNSCCNIDLLRVFRYDAVSHSQANANEAVLGSSAHSDWGTLTVVWQDDKGGLQTYCHSCDKWSDVVASSTTVTASSTLTTNEKGLGECSAQLFVHVGDFLSLATIRSNYPMWSSPRHRVVCPPLLRQNSHEDDSQTNSCRRSLVYFAYPPPGISLDAARPIVVPLSSRSSLDLSDYDLPELDKVFDHYSLLHNQAHQREESEEIGSEYNPDEGNVVSSAKQTYQRIKGVSFDEIIFDKWSQVQRRATITVPNT